MGQRQSSSARSAKLPKSANEFIEAVEKHKTTYPALEARLRENVEQKKRELDRRYQEELLKIQMEKDRIESELIRNREVAKRSPSVFSYLKIDFKINSANIFDNKYFPLEKEFKLTQDMMKVIDWASIRFPLDETLVEIDGASITRKDIETLDGLNWLNDEVINAYMHLLVARGATNGKPKVYAFNTFFYPKLRDSGYNSIKRWTRKVDIFSYDFLLVPVHLGNHWCLALVDFISRKISYYDSLNGSAKGCCQTLLAYLKSESNDKKKQDLGDENWRCEDTQFYSSIPRQENYSDCGVFTCMYAEFLTRKAKLKFGQKHMPTFRKKMIYEIVKKQIVT